MDIDLSRINTEIYEQCGLHISNFRLEKESKEYEACRFELNGLRIISRNAKNTPKKVGQFVTFWKRIANGPIEPFEEKDKIDFFVVHLRTEKEFGQFVFPKSVLIKKGIISTDKREGKRAFRVYPNWDTVNIKQAHKTQKWQMTYFYEINDSTDLRRIKELYKTE